MKGVIALIRPVQMAEGDFAWVVDHEVDVGVDLHGILSPPVQRQPPVRPQEHVWITEELRASLPAWHERPPDQAVCVREKPGDT